MARRSKDVGKPEDSTKELWDRVKGSAQPLIRDTVLPGALADAPIDAEIPKPVGTPKKQKRAQPSAFKPSMSPQDIKNPSLGSQPQELSHGFAPGVDRRTAERLKKGRMSIDGRLDLHGMSREAAHHRVIGFILDSQAAGKRCVLVVTGKGKGILQTELPRWLNMAPLRAAVLSFDHATAKDGGTGAVYVLLKRIRS